MKNEWNTKLCHKLAGRIAMIPILRIALTPVFLVWLWIEDRFNK